MWSPEWIPNLVYTRDVYMFHKDSGQGNMWVFQCNNSLVEGISSWIPCELWIPDVLGGYLHLEMPDDRVWINEDLSKDDRNTNKSGKSQKNKPKKPKINYIVHLQLDESIRNKLREVLAAVLPPSHKAPEILEILLAESGIYCKTDYNALAARYPGLEIEDHFPHLWDGTKFDIDVEESVCTLAPYMYSKGAQVVCGIMLKIWDVGTKKGISAILRSVYWMGKRTPPVDLTASSSKHRRIQ